MVTNIINYYYELYKTYRNLGLTKKNIWIKFKKIGFPKESFYTLNNMYESELKVRGA